MPLIFGTGEDRASSEYLQILSKRRRPDVKTVSFSRSLNMRRAAIPAYEITSIRFMWMIYRLKLPQCRSQIDTLSLLLNEVEYVYMIW